MFDVSARILIIIATNSNNNKQHYKQSNTKKSEREHCRSLSNRKRRKEKMPLSSTASVTPNISSSFLTKAEKEKLQSILSLIFYILVGFISYLVYSVSNRKACEFFPVPFFVSFIQLLFSSLLLFTLSFLFSWLPTSLIGNYYQPDTSSLPLAYHNSNISSFFSISSVIKKVSYQTLLLISICYTIHHILNFYTIHTGLISHLHFFNGIEPFTLLFLTQWLLPQLPPINQHSIIAIVIIIFGTIFAHMKHHFFSNITSFHFFTCFLTSFCYQVYLIQLKAIHLQQQKERKERFSLITFLACIMIISASIIFPLAYYLEYTRLNKYYNRYLVHHSDRAFVIENLIISTIAVTMSTYFNAAALDLVYPVTFSVANSLIRLIVSMISVVVSVYHRVNLLEYLGMIVSFVGYWIFYKTI